MNVFDHWMELQYWIWTCMYKLNDEALSEPGAILDSFYGSYSTPKFDLSTPNNK